MLKDIISKELIQLHVKAASWEEAIQKAGEPLVLAGKITQAYIDKAVENSKTMGPYFVIAPHIALPHARPEEGAKALAVGITVLDTPVVSGQTDNDPVKYFFFLSAVDGTSHIKALQGLSEILDGDEFTNMLDKAADADEILAWLEAR